MCSIFDVSTSGYYRWIENPISKRDIRHQELDEEIFAIFTKNESRYGATRVYKEMKNKGWKVTLNKVSERMKLMDLVSKARKRFIKTTDSKPNQYIQPNILKQNFDASAPNDKYVTDITYIPTNEGFLYLCVMIDLFSRMVIGWSMADHMRSDLVCNALHMAMFRRGMPQNVIVHSDKGSQYASKQFQDKITEYQLQSSMSGTGCCYDNAACESFFGTLKIELCDDENYKTIEQAKSSIFEYIESYYNTQRIHSSINYMTPKEYEDMMESRKQNCPKFAG